MDDQNDCLSGLVNDPVKHERPTGPHVSVSAGRTYPAAPSQVYANAVDCSSANGAVDSSSNSSSYSGSFASSFNSPFHGSLMEESAHQQGQQHQAPYSGFGENPPVYGLPAMGPCLMEMPVPFPGYPTAVGPGSVYGSFSSAGVSEGMDSITLNEIRSSPWCDSAHAQNMYMDAATDHDYGRHDQHRHLPWNADQSQQEHLGTTISPKMLRLNPSPTPTSSSESMHTSFFSGVGDATEPSSLLGFDPFEASEPQPQNRQQKAQPQEQQHPTAAASTSTRRQTHKTSKTRKQLPDAPPQRPRYQPILPNDEAHKTSTRQHPPRPPKPAAAATHPHCPFSLRPPPELPPQAHGACLSHGGGSSTQALSVKDDFLIKSKLAGMTYKEIRRKGGFTEAESTLRGRFRTLTKHKEARVRKPEWADIDVSPRTSFLFPLLGPRHLLAYHRIQHQPPFSFSSRLFHTQPLHAPTSTKGRARTKS